MYSQVKTLSNLFFRLETRSKDGSFKKLLLLFISFSIPGILLPLILAKNISDTTGFTYSFISFLFYSMIIAFTIISELDNIVVTKNEVNLLTILPVQDEVVVKAKMIVLYRYVFIIVIPLLIPGGLFYYLQTKSVIFSLLFLFAGFNLCLFIVYVIILLYSVAVNNYNPDKVSLFSMILQVVFILLLVMSYQFVSYLFAQNYSNSENSLLKVLSNPEITKYFPQSWFAYMSTKQNYLYSYKVVLKFVLPSLLVFFSNISLRVYLNDNYSSIKERFLKSISLKTNNINFIEAEDKNLSPGLISNFINKYYLRNSIERSSYFLMSRMFKNEKSVRMNIIAMGLIPVGLTIFAYFTNQLPSPFHTNFMDIKPVFHISIMLALLVAVHTCTSGLKISNFYEASWIFDTIPVKSFKTFKNGVRKFLNLYLIVPVSILIFAVFSFKFNFYQSLVHTLFIIQVAVLFNTFNYIFNRRLPFTLENTFLNSFQRITTMLIPIIFGSIFVILQVFVYTSVYSALIAAFAIFILNFILTKLFLRN
jgi:ABC-2 type transport system permease protein